MTGSLLPNYNNQTFAQIHFCDTENMRIVWGYRSLNREILKAILDDLHQYNAYLHNYRAAIETEALKEFDIVLHVDKNNRHFHSHCRT